MVQAMIKIFSENDTKYMKYGLGPLPDALSCLVDESRNGAFSLSMKYPFSGVGFNLLYPGRVLFTKSRPSDVYGEPFRIHHLEYGIDNLVNVKAYHISYDMNGIVFKGTPNGTAADISAACNALNTKRSGGSDFIQIGYDGFDPAQTPSMDIGTIKMLSEAVSGSKGSLLETYGGELRYGYEPLLDREDVTLCLERGVVRPYEIKYGFNMTGYNYQMDISNQIDTALAYIEETQNGTLSRRTVLVTINPNATLKRRALVNLTGKVAYNATQTEVEDAVDELLRGKYWTYPASNADVSFIPSRFGIDEMKLNLCDTVTVTNPFIRMITQDGSSFSTSVQMKVVRAVYNVLTDHYDKVELGIVRKSVAKTIADMQRNQRMNA